MYRFIFKICKIAFICLLFLPETSAQHDALIDSLKTRSSFERRRMIFGYAESKADSLNNKQKRDVFFEQLKNFAFSYQDQDLMQDILLMKQKQVLVMDFPREMREKKLISLAEECKKTNNLFLLAFCYHELGQIYFQEAEYEKAFENDFKAIETYQQIGFEKVPNIGKVLHEIALHLYFFRNYEDVIHLMKISLQFPPFSPGLDIQQYNNLGLAYRNIQKGDSAEYFFKKGMVVAEKYNSSIWVGILSENLADLYYEAEKYQEASVYYYKNYLYNNAEKTHITVKMNSYLSMIKIYLALDSLDKAKKFLELTENTFPQIDSIQISYKNMRHLGGKQQLEAVIKKYWQAKVSYALKTNDFKTAIGAKENLEIIEKNIRENYNASLVKNTTDKLIIQNTKTALAEKEQETIRQKTILLILVFSVFAICATAYGYMYKSKQQKKREGEMLLLRNQLMLLEKQKIASRLSQSQKELVVFRQKIVEQNNLLSLLENKDTSNKIKLNETAEDNLKHIRIVTDADWIRFQKNFEIAHPYLATSIASFIPILTLAEKRYLMLTKLGFSNKEMALAIGVSEGAIRITWKRIREKLNIISKITPLDLINEIEKNAI